MSSPATSPSAELDSRIAARRADIAAIEREMWDGGFDPARLDAYQAAYRELEELIARRGGDDRHKFVIVIPVAERPQHLRRCLDSLLELCRAYGYGGQGTDGGWRKLAVLLADDSADAGHVAANRALARHYGERGLAVEYFGPDEQAALLASLDAGVLARLRGVVGEAAAIPGGHKGQGVMRNIASLRLARLAAREPDARLLFWSVDSDQEFRVKLDTAAGERDVHAVNFLHALDEIFSTTDAQVLTGKVVGDPPVSPAVMTGNFLDDVLAFLDEASAGDGPCRHHVHSVRREGEAAYHDMAGLFGFKPAEQAYRYRCPLADDHAEADCLAHFAARLHGFFHGEHPTRVACHRHEVAYGVQPARTVYAGNYVLRPAALRHYIPFAAQRLRMSGPTLGRLLRADIGAGFVSANLPMLHRRTVPGTGRAEFRPGIRDDRHGVDFGDEFVRQFQGDVALFAIERLAALGFPRARPARADVAAALDAVRADMLDKYAAMRRDVLAKLARLRDMLSAPDRWWRQAGSAHADLEAFAANIERNFGAEAVAFARIEAAADWEAWRARLLDAIMGLPAEAQAWREALAQCAA